MSDVTQILSAIEQGDPSAAERLLPLVYEELRKLAAHKMALEDPGQTLQATALVHEAYLRLVDVDKVERWNSRGHFYSAAAEAMRRILVDKAREKATLKRGGGFDRLDFGTLEVPAAKTPDDVLALDEALTQLSEKDQQAAELVKLRYFAGLTCQEAAAAAGVSPRTGDRLWTYARAWLYRRMQNG